MAAIARQALKMPILASWNRVKRSTETTPSPQSDQKQIIETSTMNGGVETRRPSKQKAIISLSADHLHLVNGNIPRDSQSLGRRCKENWNELADTTRNLGSDPKRCTTPILQISSVSQESIRINPMQQENNLETRLQTLEMQVQKMQLHIDLKLDAVIEMLNNIKTTNINEELNEQTVSRNDSVNTNHHLLSNNTSSTPVSLKTFEKYSSGEDDASEISEQELLRDTKI